MLKNTLKSYLYLSLAWVSMAEAFTLQQSVVETLNTNPVIQERLKNYRSIQQDLNIAESEYYPSIDVTAALGYTSAGNIKKNGNSDFNHAVNDVSYLSYESSLTLTQNLFNGFGTMHKIDFEEARILAAAYKYLETSNELAFQMTNAYLEVLKTKELIGTARQNVEINEDVYLKVKDLFESGLTTESEVQKIQATLALSRSNLTVEKNNARDAEYKYRRILGRMPETATMQRPVLDIVMPESIERAAIYAIKNNPSILVARYDIKGAQALWKQKGQEMYPTLDLELSQTLNDNDELGNGFDQADDRFRARLVFSYNIFKGGADKADSQKQISKITQEIEIQRDLKRQVIEGLDLSWSAYKMIGARLADLREYNQYSEKTLAFYEEEYTLGKKSLLDLLSAQNDVINAKSQIITAEYDELFARYRVLDAMGLLVVAINGRADEFTSKVNLYTDDNAHEILDTLPQKYDVDDDKVADSIDLCDNSRFENNIMPYGCKKSKKLSVIPPVKKEVVQKIPSIEPDPDEYVVEEPEPPVQKRQTYRESPRGQNQSSYADDDRDGVQNRNDQCPNTPEGYNVNSAGCVVSKTLHINFPNNSSIMPDTGKAKVAEFADYLRENASYKINIVGYTNNIGSYDYNKWLSQRRANRIKNTLADNGIAMHRMRSEGRGEDNPVADNNTQEGLFENRRAEVEIIKNGGGF